MYKNKYFKYHKQHFLLIFYKTPLVKIFVARHCRGPHIRLSVIFRAGTSNEVAVCRWQVRGGRGIPPPMILMTSINCVDRASAPS